MQKVNYIELVLRIADGIDDEAAYKRWDAYMVIPPVDAAYVEWYDVMEVLARQVALGVRNDIRENAKE